MKSPFLGGVGERVRLLRVAVGLREPRHEVIDSHLIIYLSLDNLILYTKV